MAIFNQKILGKEIGGKKYFWWDIGQLAGIFGKKKIQFKNLK